MAHSTRTIPLVIASIIAVTLVGGAYVLSGPIPFIDRVTAQSSEELLREYAVKDTDSDGLADWQEALYGTDPENPTSFRSDLLDGEAARQELLTPKSIAPAAPDAEDFPGKDPARSSLTERFSQKFLAQYLSTRGTEPPTEAEMANFVQGAMRDLAAEASADPTYSAKDIRKGAGVGSEAYRTYAAAAALAISTNAIQADKEDLAYFAAAANEADASGLEKLEKLSDAYAAIAKALIAVEVPERMSSAHLSIANAFAGLAIATADLSALEEDPILAMLGIAEYQQYRTDLVRGYVAAHAVFSAQGVSLAEGEPGYLFYAMSSEARKADTPATP